MKKAGNMSGKEKFFKLILKHRFEYVQLTFFIGLFIIIIFLILFMRMCLFGFNFDHKVDRAISFLIMELMDNKLNKSRQFFGKIYLFMACFRKPLLSLSHLK